MKKKRALRAASLMLVLAMLAGSLAGCGAKGGGEEFSFWLAGGEESTYYSDYADNPIVKYLLDMEWGSGDDAAKLDITFEAPAKGGEQDRFNVLVNSGDFPDVMSLQYSTDSVLELYQDEVAMDITDYVEQYMPNYKALVEADPELYREAVTMVDGQPRYLSLLSINDEPRDMYQGIMYRRDWLVRFGEMPEYVWGTDADALMALDHAQRQGAAPEITNYFAAREAYGADEAAWNAGGWTKNPLYDPNGGNSFDVGVGGSRGHGITSSWGSDPMEDYTDNLVFPSGTADPLFLSDWEWMFQTFEEAVWPALGLSSNKDGGDAYMMSVYYRGSSGQGDFSSAFGRGNSLIYLDQESGRLKNGGTSENTRLYAQYMSGWYNRGWLDNKFTNSSRQADLFYQIDTPTMLAGKVGAFIGKRAIQLGNQMEDSTLPLTQGIMVFGAAIPMNDVIGDGAYRFVEPDTIYQESRIAGRSMVTTAAEGKNLAALFAFMDYLYSPEGAELVSLGLSKEQYEQTQDEFYTKWGLTDGAYVKYDSPDADGNLYTWAANNPETATLSGAARLNRIDLGLHYVGIVDHNLQAVDQYSVDCWNRYPNVGNVLANLVSKVEGDRDYNLAYAGWMDNIGALASVIKSANDTEFKVNWEYYTGLVQKDMDTVMEYMQATLDQYDSISK